MALESAASLAVISHHATALAPPAGAMEPARLVFPKCCGLRADFATHRAARSNNYGRHARLHASKGVICQQQQEILAPAGVVTDKTWTELVLDSELPVLVDFWAPWCGPCRMIAPLVDELAKKYAGRIKCYKLNTDESPNKATEYGIRSIPTVLIFKGGEKKDAIVGAVPKTTLITCIEKYLDR